VILALCLLSAASAQYCSTFTSTIGKGGACDSLKACQLGLVCINATCQNVALGSSCVGDCGLGAFGVYCLAGVCDYYRLPGDTCTSNAQCFSTNGCINGKCKSLALNAPCNGSDCTIGTFCNNIANGVCETGVAIGSSCTAQVAKFYGTATYFDYRAVCPAGVCTYSADKCLKWYSQPEGSLCDFDSNCLTGLACKNFMCTKGIVDGSNCNFTAGCSTSQSCTCDSATPPKGSCQPEACASSAVNVYLCLSQNQCTDYGMGTAFAQLKDSCGNKCASAIADFGCCIQKNHGITYNTALTCPKSSGFMLRASVLVLVALVALLLF